MFSEENSSKPNISDQELIVSISPLKPGGSNFQTHVLVASSPTKLIYKPSYGIAFFCFIFFAVGLGIFFLGIFPTFENNAESRWFLIPFGLVFATVGGFMFYNFYKPISFDKDSGFYYKTYKVSQRPDKNSSQDYIPLKSIIAIQIIGEYLSGKNGSYGSYELNLVLKDKSRKNIIDHGNLQSIIDDAQVISDFLDIPIWHAESKKLIK